jgi:hypothetical protein
VARALEVNAIARLVTRLGLRRNQTRSIRIRKAAKVKGRIYKILATSREKTRIRTKPKTKTKIGPTTNLMVVTAILARTSRAIYNSREGGIKATTNSRVTQTNPRTSPIPHNPVRTA